MVDKLRATAGANAFVEKLAPSPDFDGEAVVDRLVSELGSLEGAVVLVIDDLHELRSREARAQLETLLARRPPLLRVILATRHDPQLGLHRLRLTGELVEIRDSDLRFTREEAGELLTTAGIELSDKAIALLHARTEGWAAGLRLAALSLTGHPDPDRFVAGFSGSDRAVADYLLAEVLERQPDEVKRLLLRTSIVDRVNGALADVLVGTSGSERILHALEQQNAFVVSLDTDRSWFHCHQLFADLLRLELRRTDPSAIPVLHRAAAAWYGEHGHIVDAVRHAQAAEDWPNAARLLAEHGFSLALDGQYATVRSLLAVFPPDLASEPELALLCAYREFTTGSLEDAAAYVGVAERNAQTVPGQRKQLFEIELAVVRLTLARVHGDFDRVLGEAQTLSESIETQSAADIALGNDGRAVALMNLGIVEMWSSRIDEGERHLQQGAELARRIDRPFIEVTCLSHLALIAARRSYHEAREICREAMAIAEAQGWAGRPVVCVALATMGIADVTQGRFEEAQHWLDQAERAARPATEPATALLVQLARGMQLLALGRLREALDTLGDADRLQAMMVTPHVLTVQARWFLVQTQLKLGDTAAARATLAEMSDEERTWGEADIATAVASPRRREPAGSGREPRSGAERRRPRTARPLGSGGASPGRNRPRPPGRETGSRSRRRASPRSRRARGAHLPVHRRACARTPRTAPPPPHGPRRPDFRDLGRARRISSTGAGRTDGRAG